jgi:oxazoline/thiazoline dehydrogenase
MQGGGPVPRHCLREGVKIEGTAGTRLSLVDDAQTCDLGALTDAKAAAVLALQGEGATEDELGELVARHDSGAVAWMFFVLTRLAQLGFTQQTLTADGDRLATLQPTARNYQPGSGSAPAGQPVRLCRFAYLHRLDADMLLESPRALARIVLHHWHAAALVAQLMQPRAPERHAEAAAQLLSPATAEALLRLLYQNNFLDDSLGNSLAAETPATSELADGAKQALAQWEFHDLLFHARSRAGRHRDPYGASYRWERRHTPLPAVKEMPGDGIALPRPAAGDDPDRAPSLMTVVEQRRSLRLPGERPLTQQELGEFLFRTSRVRGRRRTEHEEVSNRPYPGGGADYELEIYPFVQRVTGLDAGRYYYDPLRHRLLRLGEADAGWQRLLKDAAIKAQMEQLPDVLFCLTGRFARLSYKYSSISYAVMLKDLGVLYQTYYLVATAMGLAPCAIGGGDADIFAAVTGLDYVVEPYVGEFMLSSRNVEEWARQAPPL